MSWAGEDTDAQNIDVNADVLLRQRREKPSR